MEMPVRSEAVALLVIAALHLIVGVVHHYAHVIADVQNTALELLFILLAITIAPWAAVYVVWRRTFEPVRPCSPCRWPRRLFSATYITSSSTAPTIMQRSWRYTAAFSSTRPSVSRWWNSPGSS